MVVDWRLGLQTGPSIGEQFQAGYDAGVQRRRNALLFDQAQQNQKLQEQQRQQAQQTAITDQHREMIRLGARIVRQINPTDQAGWDRARMAAQQAGIDLSEVPAQFDPNYMQQLLAAGQALEPRQQAQPTTLQRNYDWLRTNHPDQADAYLSRQTEQQPLVANNGDGTFTIIPRGTAQPQQQPQQQITATGPNGQRIRFNPQTNQWEPMQGGPAPQAPGTFPQ